jgi:hypothetical protein
VEGSFEEEIGRVGLDRETEEGREDCGTRGRRRREEDEPDEESLDDREDDEEEEEEEEEAVEVVEAEEDSESSSELVEAARPLLPLNPFRLTFDGKKAAGLTSKVSLLSLASLECPRATSDAKSSADVVRAFEGEEVEEEDGLECTRPRCRAGWGTLAEEEGSRGRLGGGLAEGTGVNEGRSHRRAAEVVRLVKSWLRVGNSWSSSEESES